jgi:hypothetical protein
MPHLCKEMKRPGVAKKLAADPEHEPDLYAISEQLPVQLKCDDEEAILLQCTVQGGPKARMPIYSYTGALGLGSSYRSSGTMDFNDFKLAPDESMRVVAASIAAPEVPQLNPGDKEALHAFSASLGASADLHKHPVAAAQSAATAIAAPAAMQFPSFMFPPQDLVPQAPSPALMLPANSVMAGPGKVSTLAAANQLAFGNPVAAAAFQASASQFAAGFAAAAALSQQQFQTMMASFQQHHHHQMAAAAAAAGVATDTSGVPPPVHDMTTSPQNILAAAAPSPAQAP